MTALLTIHPFTDGNGRTSRALANLLIFGDAAIARDNYIPFKDLMAISQSGFEIACNQARYFGRVAIICRWMANAVLLIHELQLRELDVIQELPGFGAMAHRSRAVAAPPTME
ncbi:hypothetical protein VI08_09605 [Luteibacter yeojuensis]|uniref:Fido domain-containing protein n=2 Tax=Luteibacter yeojuensis TaxID=345309 RepID=A0A0F3KV30_9GAMM|nr:hypothetical protein VI08_09605 [Luteibacter yeojuensis]